MPNVTPYNYAEAEAKQFCRDMMYGAGLDTYHYRGRFFWEGPAVNVDNLQEALSNTKVPCQWDSMGLGYVVYPKTSAKLLDKDDKDEDENQQLKELEEQQIRENEKAQERFKMMENFSEMFSNKRD